LRGGDVEAGGVIGSVGVVKLHQAVGVCQDDGDDHQKFDQGEGGFRGRRCERVNANIQAASLVHIRHKKILTLSNTKATNTTSPTFREFRVRLMVVIPEGQNSVIMEIEQLRPGKTIHVPVTE
jgi:hypothetical protein